MNIRWSPRAVRETAEIAEYIANDRPGAAAAWLRGLGPAVERLAVFPRSGMLVENPDEDAPERRHIRYGTHLLFYRIQPDCIEILHLRHTRQDEEDDGADDDYG